VKIDLSVLVNLGSLLGICLALYKVFKVKEAAMKADGAHVQQQVQLQSDVSGLKVKISELEVRVHQNDTDSSGYRTDIKHILDALSRIEDKLDRHIAEERKEA